MKALLYVDELRFVNDQHDPEPGPDEVLIRVRRAGICATDLEICKGYMGFQGVPGHEFVGQVLRGPAELTGKRVVGEINCVCRSCEMCRQGLSNHCRHRKVLGIHKRNGAFAEYLTLPATNIHVIPDPITDEEAVFVEPLAAACQVIKQVPVDSRMRVMVLGAGRLGNLVSQVFRRVGCRLVVVDRDRDRLRFCERLQMQTCTVHELVPRQDQDVVVDCTGSPQGLALAAALTRPRGTIVLKSTYAGGGTLDLSPLVIHEIRLLGSRCGPFTDAIAALQARHIEVGTMVSRTFDLESGLEAFAAAADPRNFKIQFQIAS